MLRASPAKSCACREEEKKEDMEMQDPPRDEGAAHVMVETREVPAIEVIRTAEVPAIEAERTQAEPSEGAKNPPAKEEPRRTRMRREMAQSPTSS